MQEQWVVSLARKLGDRQRRGVRQAVAVPDDELVEAIARVERAGGQVEALGLGSRPVRPVDAVAREFELDVGAEGDPGAALEDPPESFGDPVVRGRRRVDEQRAVAHRLQLE